jgi:hypothetical protein
MSRRIGYDHVLLLVIFLAVVSLVSGSILTGSAWVTVSDTQMALWVIMVSTFGAAVAGVVATYSFIAYMEKPELRFLLLGFVGIDAVLILFAFMFTHNSFDAWLPLYSEHQRNRTIVALFGLTLIPSALSASFRGEVPAVGERRWIIVGLGGVILPSLLVWFLASPQPVFLTIDPYGGFYNTTPIGITLMVIGFLSLGASLVRYSIEWWRGGDRISFAFMLALVLWILSLFLLLVLETAQQTLEVIWYSLISFGLMLIAVAMLMTAVTDPHRALRDLVDHRTSELRKSEKESEFYLNMWSHKVGNLLQGLITYVELSEEFGGEVQDGDAIGAAHQLGREATLVNRQVINLSRIKASKDRELEPRVLADAVETATRDVEGFLGESGISISLDVDGDACVQADDLLDLMFVSLIIYASKYKDTSKIEFTSTSADNEVSVEASCKGTCFSHERVRRMLDDDEISMDSRIGLELYTVKLLSTRYGCVLSLGPSQTPSESAITISFQRCG